MAHVWQPEFSTRLLPQGRDVRFKGLRAFEQHWRHLQVAAAQGDALEMAAASASAARACLTDGDLDETRWHLQRGQRFLAGTRACARTLTLQCRLAELNLRLAEVLAEVDEHAARRLRDDTRDAVFEVVRRAVGVTERSAMAALLLEVADILEALGDDSDAETIRLQSLEGVGYRPTAERTPASLQN